MSKNVKDITELLAGNYNPVAFAVYCLLVTGIEDSEHGEFHFTTSSIINRLTYKTGRRPTKVSRDVIRKAIDKFWENGIFEFRSSNQGNIARFPKGDDLWATSKGIV